MNSGFHAQERRRIAFPSVCLCAACVCVCALIKDTRFFKHIRAIFSNCLPASAVSSLTEDGDGSTKLCWPSYPSSITLSRPTGALRGGGPENYDLLEGGEEQSGAEEATAGCLIGEEAEEHTKSRPCSLPPPPSSSLVSVFQDTQGNMYALQHIPEEQCTNPGLNPLVLRCG